VRIRALLSSRPALDEMWCVYGRVCARQRTQEGNRVMKRESRWWPLLVPVAGAVLLVIWWRRWQAQSGRAAGPPVQFTVPIDDREDDVTIHVSWHEDAVDSEVEAAPRERDTSDDLTEIEGIGPKISKVLSDGGVTTFAQLAASEVSELERILREAGIRLAYPETWPEQAELAARGEWDLLAALQEQLHRGRRI
jgi:predicted flap endonuclease-1-like 5' DNA nuclease